MAVDDSYEIMPYKEIVELKKQIAELQRKTGDTTSKELLESMAALTKSMNNMLQLFSSAAEEMKLEEKTESELSQKVAPLIEKVDRLEEQNKTIAEGLVAIASMLKDIKKGEKVEKPKEFIPPKPSEKPEFEEFPPMGEPELPPLEPPGPMPPIRGPPPFSTGSPRVVPRRPMPPPFGPPPPGPMPFGGADFGLPPLPPLEEEPKRKGFGLFKKK